MSTLKPVWCAWVTTMSASVSRSWKHLRLRNKFFKRSSKSMQPWRGTSRSSRKWACSSRRTFMPQCNTAILYKSKTRHWVERIKNWRELTTDHQESLTRSERKKWNSIMPWWSVWSASMSLTLWHWSETNFWYKLKGCKQTTRCLSQSAKLSSWKSLRRNAFQRKHGSENFRRYSIWRSCRETSTIYKKRLLSTKQRFWVRATSSRLSTWKTKRRPATLQTGKKKSQS